MQSAASLTELFGGTTNRGPNNPHPVYRRLRRESPVLPIISLTGDASYLLTRYEDVRDTLRNDAVFSNRANERVVGAVFGRTIIEMDGREHLRHRNIVTPALAPRALKGGFAERVASIAHELIDGFAADGRVDLVSAFTFTFPLRVFTQILGLPVEDYDTFRRWAMELTAIADDTPAAFAASRTLADYLRPIVEKRRAEPRADLISRLVCAEIEGESLSDEEVISFLRLLVSAGAETTYHLIGSALYALLTHPAALEELRADRSLLQATIDETLRWECPVAITNRELVAPAQVAASRSRRERGSCWRSPRRTATRSSSRSPTASTSTAARTTTCPSASASTTARARAWPISRRRSRSAPCSTASPACGSTRTRAAGSRASPSAGRTACRCSSSAPEVRAPSPA